MFFQNYYPDLYIFGKDFLVKREEISAQKDGYLSKKMVFMALSSPAARAYLRRSSMVRPTPVDDFGKHSMQEQCQK